MSDMYILHYIVSRLKEDNITIEKSLQIFIKDTNDLFKMFDNDIEIINKLLEHKDLMHVKNNISISYSLEQIK